MCPGKPIYQYDEVWIWIDGDVDFDFDFHLEPGAGDGWSGDHTLFPKGT